MGQGEKKGTSTVLSKFLKESLTNFKGKIFWFSPKGPEEVKVPQVSYPFCKVILSFDLKTHFQF